MVIDDIGAAAVAPCDLYELSAGPLKNVISHIVGIVYATLLKLPEQPIYDSHHFSFCLWVSFSSISNPSAEMADRLGQYQSLPSLLARRFSVGM
jgi:hypothetical protein